MAEKLMRIIGMTIALLTTPVLTSCTNSVKTERYEKNITESKEKKESCTPLILYYPDFDRGYYLDKKCDMVSVIKENNIFYYLNKFGQIKQISDNIPIIERKIEKE